MLGSLGNVIHSVVVNDDGTVSAGFNSSGGYVYGSLLLTRLSFFVLYLAICIMFPVTRPMLSKYVLVFGISCTLLLIATTPVPVHVATANWIAALSVEVLMYPLALITPHEHQLTVRVGPREMNAAAPLVSVINVRRRQPYPDQHRPHAGAQQPMGHSDSRREQ